MTILLPILTVSLLLEKVSDHKVIEVHIPLRVKNHMEHRFAKQKQFIKPNWMKNKDWTHKLNEVICEWMEACALMDTASPDDTCSEVQFIDFRWRLAVLKLLTMFRVAFFLCLLEMPDDYSLRKRTRPMPSVDGRLE